MKFSITPSLIIGAVFLLGASTSSNAIDIKPLVKSGSYSNIVKVRGGGGFGGFHGGGFHGGNFGHGGGFDHGGNFRHDGNFNHYREWNGDVGASIYGGPSYDPGFDVYDADPDTGLCVGPYCPEPEY